MTMFFSFFFSLFFVKSLYWLYFDTYEGWKRKKKQGRLKLWNALNPKCEDLGSCNFTNLFFLVRITCWWSFTFLGRHILELKHLKVSSCLVFTLCIKKFLRINIGKQIYLHKFELFCIQKKFFCLLLFCMSTKFSFNCIPNYETNISA